MGLQAAFDKNLIERHIDVDKLIRAKYQDNLEFMQWMKCYWDREGAASVGYDAVQAREGKPVLPWARPLGVVAGCPETPAVKENMAAKNWAAPAPRKTNQTQPAVSSGAHVNPARSSTNASMHHAAAHVS